MASWACLGLHAIGLVGPRVRMVMLALEGVFNALLAILGVLGIEGAYE